MRSRKKIKEEREACVSVGPLLPLGVQMVKIESSASLVQDIFLNNRKWNTDAVEEEGLRDEDEK